MVNISSTYFYNELLFKHHHFDCSTFTVDPVPYGHHIKVHKHFIDINLFLFCFVFLAFTI